MKWILFPIVLAVVVCSCAKDDKQAIAETRAWESYLNQRNYAGELQCDTLEGEVWRLLENPREGRENERQAVAGSEVSIYYEGYVFFPTINLDPSISERPAPFGSNRLEIIEALGLDTRLWPSDPVVARLGDGSLFKGLDTGLQGAYANDQLLLLISSGSGYGDKTMEVVPKNAPLVFRVYVNDVR